MEPTEWDIDEVRRYLATGIDSVATEGVCATAKRAMVVGSTGPFAQLAGRKALEAGGSAADAVLTTALTQVALAAGSWVSYAGVLMLVHHGAGRVDSLSAGFAPFADETDPMSIPRWPQPSGRTALVPGFMAGVQAAHRRFGVLPWADLFRPAIYVAEHGFPVGAVRERQFAARADVLPAAFRAKRGEVFRQVELAETLRRIAAQGAEWMYHGPWARQFVDVVRGAGGKAALDDLAGYEPIWAEPRRADVYGHQVHTLGEPDHGGAALVDALTAADGIGDPLRDPQALHRLIQISRQALRPASHSDFVLAVDERGNVAAACHSINTSLWGCTGLFAGGISLPDSAAFQQNLLAGLGPGEHVPFPANPAIVVCHARPVLACSSIGTALHAATLQCLHAVLGLGVPVNQAVHRPLFHGPDYLAGDTVNTPMQDRIKGRRTGTIWQEAIERARRSGMPRERLWDAVMAEIPQVIEDRFDPDILRRTEQLGQRLAIRPVTDRSIPRGFWGGISIGDTLIGARTPASDGLVEGY
jgi:gamma-glutamyltranspeptidase/glutathione hydrolase